MIVGQPCTPGSGAVVVPVNVPSTLFLLGTGTVVGNTGGPDGQWDQYWTGSAWTQVPNLFGTNGVFLASGAWEPTSQKFYLFGSTDAGTNAFSYAPGPQTWAQLGTMPAASGSGAAIELGGKVYVFAGNNTGSTTTSAVFSYTPASTTYSSLLSAYPVQWAGVPGAVDTFGCTVNGQIYVGGGGDYTTRQTATWYAYNVGSDTYSSRASIPTAIGGCACAYLGGYIYLIGGYGGGSGQTIGTQHVFRYNVAGDSWITMGNYPIGVSHARAAVWNGTLYVLGGFSSAGFPNMVTAVYQYSVGGDSWSLHSNLPSNMAGSVAGYTGS